MKTLITTLALTLTLAAFAADPNGNPPAPKLDMIERRNQTQVELKLCWTGPLSDIDMVQIMRRTILPDGTTTNDTTRLVNPLKLQKTTVVALNQHCFWWTDKQGEKGVVYKYSVIVITENGTSVESNALASPK